jgi:hypothetical protein
VTAIDRIRRRIGAALMLAGSFVLVGASVAPPAAAASGKALGHAHSRAHENNAHASDAQENSANAPGSYTGDSDGSPSLNGSGNGNANGEPCAGCVGNADDKNPPGQLPGPEDDNNGYECDGNHGIGQTNPAHTGCTTTTTAAPTTTTAPPVTTTTAAPTTTTAAPTTTTAAPATTTTAAVLGVTVTRPPATTAVTVLGVQLARTGSNIRGLVQLAALALLLGGFCLVVGRGYNPASNARRQHP